MLKKVRLFLMRALCLIFALLFALSVILMYAHVAEEIAYLSDITDATSAEFAPLVFAGAGKANSLGVSLSSVNPVYEYDNGDTLAEVAESLRQQKFESAVGFDSEGKKILNYTSYIQNHTYMTSTLIKAFLEDDGTLFIHNHPSSAGFSVQDLFVAAKYQIPRIMVISELYVYTLEPATAEGWGDPAEIRNFYKTAYNERLEEATDYLNHTSYKRSEILAKPEREDDGSLEWFCENEARRSALEDSASFTIHIGFWVSNQALIDTAAEFGLYYQRAYYEEFDFTDVAICQMPKIADNSEVIANPAESENVEEAEVFAISES